VGNISSLPSPSQLLGAGNFTTWYPGQYDLLEQSLNWYYSPARFLGESISTGSGKSLSSLLLAHMSGARTVVLTATIGLQEQYLEMAKDVGGVVVKGQRNFPCILANGLTADEGPCHDGMPCVLREQCPYRIQLKRASESNLVITNYAYWLAQTNYSNGLGDFGLMVCVPGSTLVTLASGSQVRIDDIVNNRRRLLIKSVDLNTGAMVDSRVTGWQKIKAKERYLIKITTKYGSFSATPDHMVWIGDGYRRADTVREGDIVYVYDRRSETVGFGDDDGRRVYEFGQEPYVQCSDEDSPFGKTKGLGGCEMASNWLLVKRRAAYKQKWWLGRRPVRIPNSFICRADPILLDDLPQGKAMYFYSVAGAGRRAWSCLDVHGQWVSPARQPSIQYKQPRFWAGRESAYAGVVDRQVRYSLPSSRRQSRERVFFVIEPFGEESVVSANQAVCCPQIGIQSILCESCSLLPYLWEGISEGETGSCVFSCLQEGDEKAVESRLVSSEKRAKSGVLPTQVTKVERECCPEYVYDITVEHTHNFFANGHLVKNCDESHSCFSSMENFLTIFLSRLDLQTMGINFPSPQHEDNWGAWKTWAEIAVPVAKESADRIEQEIKDSRSRNQPILPRISRAYRTATSVYNRLQRLSDVREPWVIQKTYHGYRFTPKWVSNYASGLFHSIPKVVLMSAILSHRSMDYLGVPSGDARAWIEMPSSFPPENTPIWHIPTARINYRTDDFGTTLWCSRIDQIIQRRLDRKGIIFTVSYERARMLLSRSRFKDIMITHSTSDVIQVVEKFKKMPAPAVLVSPSVTTGYDFSMAESGHGKPQYLIVGKIPYPDTKDPVTKARHEEDKDWSSYLAMETLIQEAGRGTRSFDDKAEVLAIDDNIRWFLPRFRDFAPKWFMDRYRGSLDVVPDPLVP